MTSKSKKLLAPALSLSFFAAAFTFDQHGMSWFWKAQPGVAILLAAGATTLWILLFMSLRNARHSQR